MTDQMNETMVTQQGEAHTADCDACGGDMYYSPGKKCLVCKFCGSTKEIEFTSDQVVEISFDDVEDYVNATNWEMATKVVECKNCGGETVAAPEDETTYCIFCGSQHMVVHQESDAGLKPQGVVPYEINYKDARARMDVWVKRRWLAPRDLKDRFRGKNLKGVYMPYWTFDADVRANYHCRVGDYYYEGQGDKRKRHTRWRSYSGTYRQMFDDDLVLGIDSEEARLMRRIEPFRTDTRTVVDYKPDYLAGYMAKKHTIKPTPAWHISQEHMSNQIASEIKRQLPGDTYDSYRQSVSYRDVTFKHILLPVYMSAYEYNSKIYNVLINGQTGEVQGSAPISPVKVAGLIVLGIAIAAIVLMISNG